METRKEQKQRKIEEQVRIESEFRRRNRALRSAQLVMEGWDVFTAMGQSRFSDVFSATKHNPRYPAIYVLKQAGINVNTFADFTKKYSELDVHSFGDLVNVLINAWELGVLPSEEGAKEWVLDNIRKMQDYAQKQTHSEHRLNLRDLIAITQEKRIREKKIKAEDLLTLEAIEGRNLSVGEEVSSHLVPGGSNKARERYDWVSIRLDKHNNMLDMPIKDPQTNTPLLSEEEKSFSKKQEFYDFLYQEGIKVYPDLTVGSSENAVIAKRKAMHIDPQALSPTETASLIMYQMSRERLYTRNIFGKDTTFKTARKFYSKHSRTLDNKKNNPYKTFKKKRLDFEILKDDINDIIASLVTINMARIFFDGSTFKKMEEHFELQAARQMSKIPKEHSDWIMPYITNQVIYWSNTNYDDNYMLDMDTLKDLYRKTGRDTEGATSFHDIIFSKRIPNDYEFEDMYDFDTLVSQEKVTEIEVEQKEIGIDDVSAAKHTVKGFLLKNIANEGTNHYAKFMQKNTKLIEEMHQKGINMNNIANMIYDKIANHIDNDTDNYRKVLGAGLCATGAGLVKRYLRSQTRGDSKDFPIYGNFMMELIQEALEKAERKERAKKARKTKAQKENKDNEENLNKENTDEEDIRK